MDASLSTFGEVRSIAQGEPTANQWKKLCRMLESWEDPVSLEQVVLPYLMGALSRWPDDLRVAPEHWVSRQLGGEDIPALLVTRKIVLRSMWFGASANNSEALTHSPGFANCVILQIQAGTGVSELVAMLDAKESWLTRIKSLRFFNVDLGDELAMMLLASKNLSRLEELRLDYAKLTGATLEALAGSPMAASLKSLGLQHIDLGDAHAALDTLEKLPKLESLELRSAELGVDHMLELSELHPPEHLTSLSLRDNRARDQGTRALARGRFTNTVEVLNLSNNQIGGAGARAIAESEQSSSLKQLDLQMNRLDTDAALELARTPFLANLESLKLDLNLIGVQGWRALMESKHLGDRVKAELEPLAKEAEDF